LLIRVLIVLLLENLLVGKLLWHGWWQLTSLLQSLLQILESRFVASQRLACLAQCKFGLEAVRQVLGQVARGVLLQIDT
jgi:hypothetical protein